MGREKGKEEINISCYQRGCVPETCALVETGFFFGGALLPPLVLLVLLGRADAEDLFCACHRRGRKKVRGQVIQKESHQLNTIVHTVVGFMTVMGRTGARLSVESASSSESELCVPSDNVSTHTHKQWGYHFLAFPLKSTFLDDVDIGHWKSIKESDKSHRHAFLPFNGGLDTTLSCAVFTPGFCRLDTATRKAFNKIK